MVVTDPLKTKGRVLACMDSGVGGLAVLRRFIDEMPESAFVFVGDTAWMPYGEKPLGDIRARVADVHAWLDAEYSIGVFVLACNTATVAAYDDLIAKHLPYPVLEPVKTTAEWVNTHVNNTKRLGILATPNTVKSGRYRNYLDTRFNVTEVSCAGLASVVEAGIFEGPELNKILWPYLERLKEENVEAVISGCTHYSFILDAIQAFMGPEVQLIDSSDTLAKAALPVLDQLQLSQGESHLTVTGNPEEFKDSIRKLGLSCLTDTPVRYTDLLPKQEICPSRTD